MRAASWGKLRSVRAGGDTVLTHKLRRRHACGLAAAILAATSTGCARPDTAVQNRTVHRPAGIAASDRPVKRVRPNITTSTVDRSDANGAAESDRDASRAKPGRDVKPPKAAPARRKAAPRDDYDRHPSRWRHKLKAKYA